MKQQVAYHPVAGESPMTFSTEHGDLPARGTEMARTSQPPWIPHGAAPFEDRHRVILTVARAAFREKGSGHFACRQMFSFIPKSSRLRLNPWSWSIYCIGFPTFIKYIYCNNYTLLLDYLKNVNDLQ